MNIKIQFALNNDFYLKKYLREHSYFYKDLIRNPRFINNLVELMKKEYGFTLNDRLEKIKDNMKAFNAFMDVLK